MSFRVISPGYLAALGAPLIRGRGLVDSDGPASAGVALVNEVLARRFWPTEDPIGNIISARPLGSTSVAPWWPDQMTDTFTIVGVDSNGVVSSNSSTTTTGPTVSLTVTAPPKTP